MSKRIAVFILTGALLLSTAGGSCQAGSTPSAADRVRDGEAIDLSSPRYQGLFKELRLRHGFTGQELERMFGGVTIKKRVLELMDRQWEAKPYYQYYPIFINDAVIEAGRQKLAQHAELLDRIERELGVEREIVVAIWGMETRYGGNLGDFNVFQTLNTLFDAYPRRREFFRNQLISFLLLLKENRLDLQEVRGSYAGAFGQTQFIPSSYRAYAVDFDGDGQTNTMRSVPDILASIANYLKEFGWTLGEPIYHGLGKTLQDGRLVAAYEKGRQGFVSRALLQEAQGIDLPPVPGDQKLTIVGLEQADGTVRYVAGYPNFQAITAWNHSNRYAMAVTELAEKLAGKNSSS